ncbi:MAG: glutamate-1-semialdehyde 2,1-aminomutase [Gammaproteobacteria bacterium]
MSEQYFAQAKKVIPGGVNSPVRAFGSVGGTPVFVASAKGAKVTSQDGREFTDYVGSWGPMILGHADSRVVSRVQKAAEHGLSFGAPTVHETELAELICNIMPSMERVRMVSSGTEATMSAIRLARGYTGRTMLLKFTGCYHGHADALLIKAGSGPLTLGIPGSAGVPPGAAQDTLTADFNDVDSLRSVFKEYGDQIACVIAEPIAGNMNMVLPKPEFLAAIRELCDEYKSVMILDEVMTGFRVAMGGAQSVYNVKPDLTTLGKVVGGGMPVGVFGGKREIMEHVAPLGPVYQAGTLSGNPLGMAAGIETLTHIQAPGFYSNLEAMATRLIEGLKKAATEHNIPLQAHCMGGMFGVFFSDEADISSFEQVTRCNIEHFKLFFRGMLERGHYFAPSAYEAGFISGAHTESDVDGTIEAARSVFATLAG